MKKKLVIEMLVYAVILVIGIVLLFTYEPEERVIVIPRDFEIHWEGVEE